jgi:hypothetical protein
MSNVCQAIQIHLDLPEEDQLLMDQALSTLRGIGSRYPQLREGLSLRALRELWPPAQHDLLDDRIQMTLTLAPEVKVLPSEDAWNAPVGCDAKIIEGAILCDRCAVRFAPLMEKAFRCQR